MYMNISSPAALRRNGPLQLTRTDIGPKTDEFTAKFTVVNENALGTSCEFFLDKSTQFGKPVLYVRDFNVRSVKVPALFKRPG